MPVREHPSDSRSSSVGPRTVDGQVKLVLFDLDGVLIDSLEVMALAWEEVQARTGVIAPFDAYANELGRPFDEIITRLGYRHELVQIKEVYESRARREIERIEMYPGVTTMLDELRTAGVMIGVVTSKHREAAVRILDRCEIEHACLKTPEDGQGKPSPDLLWKALDDLDVAAAESVYVGDMEVDRRAASSARVGFLHAAWGYGVMKKRVATVLHPGEVSQAVL
jgi:HAD superfamily hydrolase (TIGR01509 family)